MRSLLWDIVPTRQGLPRDLCGHLAPFVQWVETLLDDTVKPPKHLKWVRDLMARVEAVLVVHQINGGAGAVVFAQAVGGTWMAEAAGVFFDSSGVKGRHASAAIAHHVLDVGSWVGFNQTLG